jgi:hypothetical protein
MTKVARIDLSAVQDLAQAIIDTCEGQSFAGLRLASTFVFGTQLILIFQQ